MLHLSSVNDFAQTVYNAPQVWLVVHHMAPSDVHQDTSKPGAHPDIQPAMLPEVAPQTIAGGAGVAAIMHLHLNQVLPQAHQPAQHPAQPQVQQQ